MNARRVLLDARRMRAIVGHGFAVVRPTLARSPPVFYLYDLQPERDDRVLSCTLDRRALFGAPRSVAGGDGGAPLRHDAGPGTALWPGPPDFHQFIARYGTVQYGPAGGRGPAGRSRAA